MEGQQGEWAAEAEAVTGCLTGAEAGTPMCEMHAEKLGRKRAQMYSPTLEARRPCPQGMSSSNVKWLCGHTAGDTVASRGTR